MSAVTQPVGDFLSDVWGRDGARRSGYVRWLPVLAARHYQTLGQRHDADDGVSAMMFVIVLSSYIAANVSEHSMSALSIGGWLSAAMAFSMILIIALIKYA